MKKKMMVVFVCMAMGMALCACSKLNPVGTQTGNLTTAVTDVPQATATPSPLEEMYMNLPVSDYDDYVESTMLPEGYIGFEVEAVTDADVEQYVLDTLANYTERELKETPLEEGDIVIIDYVGRVDGVAFEGGTAYSQELEIGSNRYIEGFEDGLIGAKKGDTVVLNLKFPEDYGATDLAGKDVVFEVTIRSSAAQIWPEFTDDFVVMVTSGEYTTTEEFRMYARGFLQEERRYNGVMDHLVKNSVFNKINEEYIQAAFELEKAYYALAYGWETVEQLEAAWGEEYAEAMWLVVEAQIRRYEKDRVVLYCVAKAENLELTEDEFIKSATEYAESIGMTYAELIAVEDEKALRQSMLMELAMEYLLENVVVVEKGAE